MYCLFRYLATGESFKSLHYHFRLGERAISGIVYKISQAICDLGGPIFLKTPTNEKLLEVADKFERLWNFPNCLGSIDGKHVRIQCPSGAGSEFSKLQKILFNCVASCSRCRWEILIYWCRRIREKQWWGSIQNSTFGKKLSRGFDLPRRELPFLFVGDEAYPLKGNLMTPYPRKTITPEKWVFNYRLSRAQRVVECAFGMLTKTFLFFLKTNILLPPVKVVILT